MVLRILLLSAIFAASFAFTPNAAVAATTLHRSSASASTALNMADEVKVGDKLPSVVLKEGQANYETPVDVNLSDLITGKKVAIFAVPGAFTPGKSLGKAFVSASPIIIFILTEIRRKIMRLSHSHLSQGCSKSHLPSFITAQEELKGKGVDMTICVATNDAYVMEVRSINTLRSFSFY